MKLYRFGPAVGMPIDAYGSSFALARLARSDGTTPRGGNLASRRPRSAAPADMTSGVDLLVVRHAESTWNAEHRWAGQRDPGLSAKGRRAAAELARRLAALDPPFTSAASSDLRRARQTAQLVARALGLPPPVAVAGLRERDGGQWTGLTSRQIEARFPGELGRRPGQRRQASRRLAAGHPGHAWLARPLVSGRGTRLDGPGWH